MKLSLLIIIFLASCGSVTGPVEEPDIVGQWKNYDSPFRRIYTYKLGGDLLVTDIGRVVADSATWTISNDTVTMTYRYYYTSPSWQWHSDSYKYRVYNDSLEFIYNDTTCIFTRVE